MQGKLGQELVASPIREVGNPGWVRVRGLYLQGLRGRYRWLNTEPKACPRRANELNDANVDLVTSSPANSQ